MSEHNIFCAVNDALDPDDTCDCGADERVTEDRVATLHGLLNDAAEKVGQQRKTISELREALGHLIKAYVSLLEAAHERITDLGGDCDSVEVMEAQDPRLRKARAALNRTGE